MKKLYFIILVCFLDTSLLANEFLDLKKANQGAQKKLILLFKDKPDYHIDWSSNFLHLTINNIDNLEHQRYVLNKILDSSVDFKINKKHLFIISKSIQKKYSKFELLKDESSGFYRLKIQWQIEEKKDQGTLWNNAKDELSNGHYDRAIRLMTKLLEIGDENHKMMAQEFIGVARERKGQLAFARDNYKRFLKLYPKSKSVPRVKQRLSALIGIETYEKNRTLKKRQFRSQRKTNGWNSYGSISGDYRYSSTIDNSGTSTNTLSLINADLDVTSRYRNDDLEFQTRFSGGEYQDLRKGGQASSERLRYFYFDAETKDRKYKARIGRQRSHNGGVFGRFDGMITKAKFFDDLSINLVAGYPVDTSRNTSVDTSRKFYGLNLDITDIWSKLDTNLFVIQQNVGSLTDRQAVGGDLRYRDDNQSFYSLIDYDIHFHALNAFLLNGNHRLKNRTRINWSLNIRKSPYLSTRNALIGQPVDSIQELQQLFITDAEILDLALDRTLESKSASIQVSMPYSSEVDISSSLTWLHLSESPSSGGVPGFASSGGQYYFNLQATGRKVISDNDISYAGIRISQLKQSSIYSAYVNSRIPWHKKFSLNPKLRLDYRNNKDGSSQINISPSFRLQYQEKQHIFYAETGAIYFLNQVPTFQSQNTTILYVYMGYRYSYY